MIWELIGKILQKITKEVINATANYIEFEDRVRKDFREFGHTGQQLHNITKGILVDTQKWSSQYGMTRDEIEKVRVSLSKAYSTTQQFSNETKGSALALSKMFGADSVANFNKSMAQTGMHAKSAQAWMGKGAIQAKAMGLNAKEFNDKIADSVGLMHKMHFKTGITGLQKMTALATRLGTTVEKLTSHIDIDNGNFSNIEKSIETAANIQRLGGSFAANFGNPMEVMAEGMFDAESSMERVLKAIDGKGTFNRATGQVDMSWFDARQLGDFAKAMGMDPNEVRQMAKRQAMGKTIENDLRGNVAYGALSEEEKEAIKNLADYDAETGKFNVSWTDEHGDTHTEKIEDLTSDQLKNVINLTEAEKNVDRNVATITHQVTAIADAMGASAKDTASFKEVAAGTKSGWGAKLTDWLGLDSVVDWGKGAMQWIGNLFADGGIVGSPMSAKGIVPKFATGGFFESPTVVPGNSTQGDKVLARVNSGEMILNKKQQSKLFNLLDGSSKFADGGIVEGDDSIPKFAGGGIAYGTAALGNKIINVVASPGFERTLTNVVDKSSKLVTNAYKLIPTSLKDIKNTAKLYVSYKKGSFFNPLGLTSNNNLFGRFMRMKAHKAGFTGVSNLMSQIGKGVDTVNSAFKTTGKAIISPLQKLGTYIGTKVSAGATSLSGKFGGTLIGQELQTVGKDLSSAGKLLMKPIKFIGTSLSKAGSAIGSGANTLLKGAKQIAKPIADVAGKAAKWAGGKAISGVTKLAKGASGLASRAGTGIVNGASKFLGAGAGSALKAAGPIGAAISAGIGIFQAGSAISDFSKTKDEIEARTDLTKQQKKQMLREAEDQRNEKVGGAAGSVVGGVAGAALGSFLGPLGTAAGGMIGSFIGEKVGGFIGKSVNGIKDFLFGKEAEMSEEDQAQLDYEETKMGQVSIEDPQLMEKAAVSTVAMHDLLISIWHHMNGKAANGEEEKKGLFGKIGDAAGSIVKGAVGVVSMPFKAVGSVINGVTNGIKSIGSGIANFFGFGGKKEEESENVEKGEETSLNGTTIDDPQLMEKAALATISIYDLLNNREKGQTDNKGKLKPIVGTGLRSILGLAIGGPLGLLAASQFGKVNRSKNEEGAVAKEETTTEIEPTPIGETPTKVEAKESNIYSDSSSSSSFNGAETIKVEVGGTIKLDAGSGNSKDVDIKKLLDTPEMRNMIIDIVFKGLNARGNGGKYQQNTSSFILNGAK